MHGVFLVFFLCLALYCSYVNSLLLLGKGKQLFGTAQQEVGIPVPRLCLPGRLPLSNPLDFL